MNKEQILASVRRKSSAILKKDLEKEISSEKKELIELVLRQRGALEEEPTEVVKLTKEQISKIDRVITEVCEINDSKLTSQIGNILDTVEEYSDLTVEQALQIEKLLSGFKKETKKSGESKSEIPSTKEKKETPVKEVKPAKKGVELTDEQKLSLEGVLQELERGTKSKREAIIFLMESGFTKQQIDKNVDDKILHWSTVYAIYRENGK